MQETNTECHVFYYITEIFNVFSVFAICTSVFILRTYVIFGRSWPIFFLLAIAGFVVVASDIWIIVAQIAVALPSQLQVRPWTCGFNSSSSANTANQINFVSDAIFDALVLILTIYRTGRLALQSRQASTSSRSRSLSFTLFRGGMLYYGAIFIPQFVEIALVAATLKTDNINIQDASSAVSIVVEALQIVLVNRLILNLNHTVNTRDDSEFHTRTSFEPPTFAAGPTFLGNIGGPVRMLELNNDIIEGDASLNGEEIQLEGKRAGNIAESNCNFTVYSDYTRGIEEISG